MIHAKNLIELAHSEADLMREETINFINALDKKAA